MSFQAAHNAVHGGALHLVPLAVMVEAAPVEWALQSLDRRERKLILNRWAFRCCALAALMLSACGDPRFEWREQVKLQDGQTILVERSAEFSENWVAGGGGGSVNKGMSLRFVQPLAPDAPAPWSAPYVPMLLDRDPQTQEWVLLATFFHCDSWVALGKPQLPYTEYRYRGSRWVQQPLGSRWIGRTANLLVADPSRKSVMTDRNVLTIEAKQAIVEGSTMLPEYQRIVDHWSSGC